MAAINYRDILANTPFDIRVEALAAELLEKDQTLAGSGQVLVRPMGHVNRNTGWEVQAISEINYTSGGEENIYLDINREGLFDALPEMLFIREEEKYEDVVEKAAHLARQKEMARRFFLPFEQVLYRARIDLEIAERKAEKTLSSWLLAIYGLNLDAVDESCRESMYAFALVLPHLNGIVGNIDTTAKLLESVTGKEVTITRGNPQLYTIPELQQSSVGEAILGENLLLGGNFSDGICTLEISFGNISPEEVESWLPGGGMRQMVETQLFPYLIPAGEGVELIILINDTLCDFLLDEEKATTILGYTTKLN
jgi:hypothetical protein